MAQRSRQVFISYQRSDHAFARVVREHLVAAGVQTWMDQFDIAVGAYLTDEIDKGLASSDIVVGILSPDAVESRNVKNEWDWAIQNDKPLLLLQYRRCVVPHRYVSINFIDATDHDSSGALGALLGTLGMAPAGASVREISDAVTPHRFITVVERRSVAGVPNLSSLVANGSRRTSGRSSTGSLSGAGRSCSLAAKPAPARPC
jgi:hypothetical protein